MVLSGQRLMGLLYANFVTAHPKMLTMRPWVKRIKLFFGPPIRATVSSGDYSCRSGSA